MGFLSLKTAGAAFPTLFSMEMVKSHNGFVQASEETAPLLMRLILDKFIMNWNSHVVLVDGLFKANPSTIQNLSADTQPVYNEKNGHKGTGKGLEKIRMEDEGKEEKYTIRDLQKVDIPPILSLAEHGLGKNDIRESTF